MKLDAEQVVKVIYGSIEEDIENLKMSLGETPDVASVAYHDQTHDVFNYGGFMSSCDQITLLLTLLDELKISPDVRDKDFETNARTWSFI